MKSVASSIALLFILLATGCNTEHPLQLPEKKSLSLDLLQDKIKGGWAGQTLGCSYGGYTEYKYMGCPIYPHTPIKWHEGIVKEQFTADPYLYDDIYMDLTFVEVFHRVGLDAPVDSFANAFANASYKLWHGNQGARYAILQGVPPAEAGHWKNNPHADDLDFQIESDFAGIMSPGMAQTATEITDRIGHMIGYGDGWYGGVFVANLYALAFVCDDIEVIVNEALKAIPAESKFHQTIATVIDCHRQFPDDWLRCWFEVDRRWNYDIGCPDGPFTGFSIDASLNAAYITIGLLYGDGDFYKSVDISTRCGQDSDCNPANVGGIIGTIIGYEQIPEIFKKEMPAIENLPFKFMNVTHADAYRWSFEQACELIRRNGGEVTDRDVTIAVQTPQPVRFEKSFGQLIPTDKMYIKKGIDEMTDLSFTGQGVAIVGEVRGPQEYVARMQAFDRGTLIKEWNLPCNALHQSAGTLFWNYDLPKGEHILSFKWANPQPGVNIRFEAAVVYDDTPLPSPFAHLQK